jgi:hypothetical protein
VLVIKNEQTVKKLQQIAERKKRPVEDILAEIVEQVPVEAPTQPSKLNKSEDIKRIRRNAYAKARQYWESVGDTAKTVLTDEELDEQFGAFDEEGIPRLKNELSPEPPVGSLAYAAMVSRRGTLNSGQPDLARRSKELLDEYFADDILRRMRGGDGREQDPPG